jgi:hypothetical protein
MKKEPVEIWVVEGKPKQLKQLAFAPFCGTKACRSREHAKDLAKELAAEKQFITRVALYRRVK